MISPDSPDEPNNPHHTLKVLQRLNRQLDELVKIKGPTAEQLQERLDSSAQTTLIIQLDRLSSILIESARSSLVSTEENLHLQRRVWWLTIAAVALAAIATYGTFAQVYYAQHADSRAISQEQSQSQTPTKP